MRLRVSMGSGMIEFMDGLVLTMASVYLLAVKSGWLLVYGAWCEL